MRYIWKHIQNSPNRLKWWTFHHSKFYSALKIIFDRCWSHSRMVLMPSPALLCYSAPHLQVGWPPWLLTAYCLKFFRLRRLEKGKRLHDYLYCRLQILLSLKYVVMAILQMIRRRALASLTWSKMLLPLMLFSLTSRGSLILISVNSGSEQALIIIDESLTPKFK